MLVTSSLLVPRGATLSNTLPYAPPSVHFVRYRCRCGASAIFFSRRTVGASRYTRRMLLSIASSSSGDYVAPFTSSRRMNWNKKLRFGSVGPSENGLIRGTARANSFYKPSNSRMVLSYDPLRLHAEPECLTLVPEQDINSACDPSIRLTECTYISFWL